MYALNQFKGEQVTIRPNMLAFPTANGSSGMKLRDYFAAQAMSGMLADPNVTLGGDGFTRIARTAYAMADAMLEARAEVSDE
jgi:hypothetical protein